MILKLSIFGSVFWLALALALAWANSASADFVLYQLPGTGTTIVLEGKAKALGLGLVEFDHPKGMLAFSQSNSSIIKCPTREEEFQRLFLAAKRSGTVEGYLDAAAQAIRRGLLKEFRECCNAAYKIDPNHPAVERLLEARRRIDRTIIDDAGTTRELSDFVGASPMEIESSAHYMMMHDTGKSKVGRGRKTRAQSRLDLLEKVYESYFMKFALDGILLEPPKERMKVVLFGEERDYQRFSKQLDASLGSALGYWSPSNNIAVFFDQGTTQRMKGLQQWSAQLQREKMRARGTAVSKDMAHMANTLQLLVKVIRDEDDIEVVSHEATHQLAGNTGLMPRGKIALRWAHEGLATYFETSSNAGWGGIGAVNDGRLKGYRRVSSDPRRASLEVLISDALFDGARDAREASDAYGQAWALTHFLMETRGPALIEYYRKVSELSGDADGNLERRVLVDQFQKSFGDLRILEGQWHAYMQSLKTDIDRMREAMR